MYNTYEQDEKTGFQFKEVGAVNRQEYEKYKAVLLEVDPEDVEGLDGNESYAQQIVEMASRDGLFHLGNMMEVWASNGTTVYAGLVEIGGGKLQVRIRIRYSDGTFSEDITHMQSEIKAAGRGNCGEKDETGNIDKNALAIAKRIRDEFIEYERPNVNFDTNLIIERINFYFNRLPIKKSVSKALDVQAVYASCISWAVNKRNLYAYPYIDGKTAYRFTSDNMSDIAKEFDVSADRLVKILYDADLLSLTPSSKGYQTKVRDVGYCYCVRKIVIQPVEVSDKRPETNSKEETDSKIAVKENRGNNDMTVCAVNAGNIIRLGRDHHNKMLTYSTRL